MASPAGERAQQGLTCTTTMLPTAAAACAARGEGGSPCGTKRSHLPLRTSMMCTSLVAPASLMPARVHANKRQLPPVALAERAQHAQAVCAPQPGALTALLGNGSRGTPVPEGGPGDAGGPPSVRCVPSSAVAPPACARLRCCSVQH